VDAWGELRRIPVVVTDSAQSARGVTTPRARN
jgi:hypothetical protein